MGWIFGCCCCATPCSIQAKVFHPQLGNTCHPALGGPVNNGFSQEQVVVTWNSERGLCISGRVHVHVFIRQDRARERLACPPSGASGRSQMRQKTCAISISLLTRLSPGHESFLLWTPWFLAMPLVMAHTPILRVWNEPLQGVQHSLLKWIDPKWDQQAKSSLFIGSLPQTD